MKKTTLGLGLITMFLAVSAAHAEVGLSTELGTTGVGIHATLPVLTNLNARIGVNAFSYSYNGSTSNVDYKFKLKLQTLDLLADYYPIASSGFRLTGGLIYNGNKVDATGKPNQAGTYTLNGNTYSSSSVGSLNGRVDFRKIAPYVGLGWGNALAKDSNWSFTTDIGAMFEGSARTSLTSSDCTASTAICSQLASDLSAENQKLADKASKLRVWPVIRFGVAYKF